MRALLLLFLLGLSCGLCSAQNPDAASIKVDEGIKLHDQQDYKKALKKYDEALKLDNDNLTAMVEKALTLNAMNEFEKSAALCQEVIEKHNGAKEAPSVYVTYGNCMDQLKRPEASLRVYDKGISVLPTSYMLHFNKGITLVGMDSVDSAMRCFERSARYNPYHPGTQNAMGRMLIGKKKSIPGTLALCRFFVLEPESPRAKENLSIIMRDLQSNSSRTKEGGVNIQVDASMLRDSTDTVHVENDFRDEELVWSTMKGMDLFGALTQALKAMDDKKEGTTTINLDAAAPTSPMGLKGKLDELASLLKDGRAKNHGFQWDYYAAWLIALKEAEHTEALAYLAFANTDDKEVRKWFKENEKKVGAFYGWDKEYTNQYLKAKGGE